MPTLQRRDNSCPYLYVHRSPKEGTYHSFHLWATVLACYLVWIADKKSECSFFKAVVIKFSLRHVTTIVCQVWMVDKRSGCCFC